MATSSTPSQTQQYAGGGGGRSARRRSTRPCSSASTTSTTSRPTRNADPPDAADELNVRNLWISACVADVNMAEDGMGSPRVRKGYDARHRVALCRVATWLDVKWNKMRRRKNNRVKACHANQQMGELEAWRDHRRSRADRWNTDGYIRRFSSSGNCCRLHCYRSHTACPCPCYRSQWLCFYRHRSWAHCWLCGCCRIVWSCWSWVDWDQNGQTNWNCERI